MRADEHVHLAGGEVLEDLLLLGRRAEARDHLHLDREVGEALPEGAVVLLRQDGGGHQHHHLLAVQRGLEGGPQRHLGLAVAHVAAEQPVHGLLGLHVVLDRVDGPQLVLGLLVGEGLLEAHLPLAVLGEAVALGGLAQRVEVQQLAGHLAGGLAHPALDVLPGLAAQLGEAGRRPARPHVAHDLGDLVVRDVEHVRVPVGQVEVVAGDAGHRLGGDALEAAHPVVLVHHVVALAQVAEAGERHPGRGPPRGATALCRRGKTWASVSRASLSSGITKWRRCGTGRNDTPGPASTSPPWTSVPLVRRST